MKMRFLAVLSAFLILTLSGCGSDHNDGPPLFVSEILSDPTFDGDIQRDFNTGLLTVAQGSVDTDQRVFAGTDPISVDEYRAFLHFPLTGVNGVPVDAIIESAFLEIFINNIVTSTDTIPFRIDLVSFPQPLIETDFNRAALGGPVRFSMFLEDSRDYVTVDVTSLMIAAQNLKLSNFQIRIMEEGNVPLGRIEINNTTGGDRNLLAPLLTVNYF